MCQLTFSDLGSLNPMYITNQLVLNAMDNNPDGVGLVTKDTIWKSELNACLITNLGVCIASNVNTEPVIAHVRLASNKWLDKIEHSHPFEGDLVVQAHNGKLEPKDKTISMTGKVDSQVFLQQFEKYWKDNSTFALPKALSSFMKEWEGKFAFLYYQKASDNYYVVRGKTADLHYTKVNGKLVVNTSKKTLELSLHNLNLLNQLTFGTELEIDDIKKVKKNSVYLFDKSKSDLVKVGDIEENELTQATVTVYEGWRGYSRYGYDDYPETTKSKLTTAEKLGNLIKANKITLEDADFLASMTMGDSLLELNILEQQSFMDDVLKLLVDKRDNKKDEVWDVLQQAGLARTAYKEGLTFPWMYASFKELKDMATRLGVYKDDSST